jgi:hypothetical protein
VTKTLRRSLAAITVAVALTLTFTGAASADVPEGWSNPDPVSFMHTLLVLVGVPLLVLVLITLAVYVPAVVRGENVTPAGARADNEWFGGRRDTGKALEAGASADSDDTGGASGTW